VGWTVLDEARQRAGRNIRTGCLEELAGTLVEDDLIAEAVRACLDLASSCASEEVVELGSDRHLIGMRLGGSTARLWSARDLGFEGANRPAALRCTLGEFASTTVGRGDV
jgi:hypothetical protein